MATINYVLIDFYMTNTIFVEYESGMKRYYSFDRIPKTAEAWLKERRPEEWERIEIERNPFGMVACVASVRMDVETLHKDPVEMMKDFKHRAERDIFFNKTMITALEQYMEEHGITKGEEEMTAEERMEVSRITMAAVDAVKTAYKGTDKPSEAIQALVETFGQEEASKMVAITVNAVSPHDGRIYDNVREWAESVPGAYSNEVLRSVGIYGVDSWIHSAHVNQIGQAMRDYEPTDEPEEPEDLPQIEEEEIEDVTDVIAEFSESTEYAEYICDYLGSQYIYDVFTYIADDNTSIYYSDIIDFISKNVEMVGDTISEFGWDGCGSDLYKAGQMAEFRSIETELNENIVDVLKVYAFNYYREQYGEHVRTETRERISNHIDDHWGDFDTLGDIEDIVNEYANC